MKLFTKETLTHTSLYQLEVTHRDREIRGQVRGERIFGFFFLVLVFVSLLDCALLTRTSKEGKSQPGGESRGRRAGCG